jgi:Rrf2 family protein
MLSKKTKYALKALVYLARQEESRHVLISKIAEAEGIPRKFLELILLDLKNQGILHSKKGRGGGYALARPAHSIFLGQIVRLFDGPLALLPCVSVTAYRRCEECSDEESCGIRMVMKRVRDATARILDRTSLAAVLKQIGMEKAAKGRTRTMQRQPGGMSL